MVAFSPIDFYNILHDIAASFPFVTLEGRDVKSRRINTFAVTKKLLEVLSSNSLGKDSRYIGKRLFYSTKWNGLDSAIEYEYPALFIGPSNVMYEIRGDFYYVDYSLVFGDQFEPKMGVTGNQDIDSSRTFEEVEQSLLDLWGIVFATLKTYAYYKLYLGNTLVGAGWFSSGYIQQLKTAGTITRSESMQSLLGLMSDIEAMPQVDGNAPKIITYILSMRIKHSSCQAYEALPTPTPNNL